MLVSKFFKKIFSTQSSFELENFISAKFSKKTHDQIYEPTVGSFYKVILAPIVILWVFKNKFQDRFLSSESRFSGDEVTESTTDLEKNYISLSSKYKDYPQNEKVSVIVPTWNRKSVLLKAIESVINQTYQNFELIISDDGSTDGTIELLQKKYSTQLSLGQIVLIQNDHIGVSNARNKGLEVASGTYICYLDSDNTWRSNYLLISINKILEKNANVAYSGILISDKAKKEKKTLFKQTFDYEQLTLSNYIDLNALCHSKALYEKHGGFDTNLKRLVDWDLVLRYLAENKVIEIPIAAVNYSLDKGLNNITTTENFEENYNKVKAKLEYPNQFLGKKHPFDSILESDQIAYVLWQFPTLSETFIRKEIVELAKTYSIKIYFKEVVASSVAFDEIDVPSEQVFDAEELAEKLSKDNVKLIHSHFAYPTVTNLVWPAAEKAKVPFTYLSHGVDMFHYNNIRRNRWADVTSSEYCLRSYALGSFHRKFMIGEGARVDKVTTRSQYIDCDDFEFFPTLPKGDRQSICALGRFIEKKGVEYLILSAKYLPQVDFNIYGWGDLEKEYQELIEENNLKNVFIKEPLKGNDQVNEVLRSHDMFALPCVRASNGDLDGIPTVLAEAMLAGTPVISTDVSSIPDVILDQVNGFLVPQRNPEKIAEKIGHYLSLSDIEKNQVINNARQTILTKYNKQNLINRYSRIWFNKTIDIFLVSYNNLEELKVIINRVYKYTTCYFNLYVVDNNSSKETKAYLKALESKAENVFIELLDENIWCGPASNLALSKGTSDYAVYLCSKEGFVMNYDWEWDMIQYMDNHHKVGIAGHTNVSPSFSTFEDLKSLDVFNKFRNQEYADTRLKDTFDFMQGGVYILRRKMFDEIGGFNDLTPHGHMDVEYSYYLESKGWEIGELDHVASMTIKTRPNLEAYFNRSSKLLHPMTILKSRDYDEVIKNNLNHCSKCDHIGRFRDVCPKCHARPEERLVYKYFAANEKIYKQNIMSINGNMMFALDSVKKMFKVEKGTSENVPSTITPNHVYLEKAKSPFLSRSIQEIVSDIEVVQKNEGELVFCGKTSEFDESVKLFDEHNIAYNLVSYMDESEGLLGYSLLVIK